MAQEQRRQMPTWVWFSFAVLFLVFAILVFGYIFITYKMCDDGLYQDGLSCIMAPTEGKPAWSSLLATAPAYIINIERAAYRFPVCEQRLRAAGFQHVKKYIGVDGKRAHLPSEWAKHVDRPITLRRGLRSAANILSEQGCALSWLGLIRTIAEGPDEWVFAFEDDILFHPEWEKLAPVYYNLTPNNMDLVYMGFMGTSYVGSSKLVRTPCFGMQSLLFTRTGARKVYNLLLSRPSFYSIDEMLYDAFWGTTFNSQSNGIEYYCWNYRDPAYMLQEGQKGLVYQDRKTFVSTITGSA